MNFVLKYSLTVSELPEKIPLFILYSNESLSLFITHYTNHKNSDGIISSTSNDFATAVNSVALVGELKTPSLPPSVHIPSIIPSQSLLTSRDEVFKEIKDFGKDVAISSLHLFQADMDLPILSFHASLEEKWDQEEEPEEIETVLKVVPPAYHQYLDVFSKVKTEKLSPHCTKRRGRFHKTSSSSTGAPVPFVKKKDGGLCLRVDYRKLNSVTKKNRYPVARINQLLTVFNGSTIFSKIDLRGAYNLLRIKEGDDHLTAFRTKYGSYEYLVMPFGLTNAPASFQNLVTDIFAYFLDVFVVVYLDDIMVFSSSEEEHVKNVTSVLQILRDNIFFQKPQNLVDKIQKEVWKDKEYKKMLKQLARDSPAGKLSKKLQSVQKAVKEELESERRRFKKYADKNRAIPPNFQPGDKVWLASKKIKTTRTTKKLSERWLGQFEVLKKIGSHAYHLKLPQKWKSVHPVFHVSLLEQVKQSSIPNCNQLPPPPVLVEEQEEWEVAQVLDSKLKRG
ncbi:hypothetical protein O181_037145 [Austropuccinia psidii MF-1]|uniref:Reverse transcriptase domain-containing protein n=1 Tax=Austropuccinia psidii MF-1 TaxID=1389203 RepID=A0A9Q3D7Q3_9BASI|nr:hypothetical protein [Austropuccinia psidii MF-1]